MVPHGESFALAQRFQQAGNLLAAEQLYRQILHADPRHADALHFLGVLKSQVGDQGLALQYMQQALALRPQAAHFHANLGLIHQALGQYEQAEACLREALRLRPDFAEAHYNLGTVLAATGKNDKAVACLREAVRLKPHYVEALVNLGRVYQKQGQRTEAIACYREALRHRPDCAEAHIQLGIALYEQEAMPQALAAFREALRLKPNDGEAHKNVGLVLCKLGRQEEAVASSREAARLRPEDADIYNNLGNALVGLGRLEEAVASYRESLRLAPDRAEIMSNLARALECQGKLDEALGFLRRALELKPDWASAHFNLSELLLKGDYALNADAVQHVRLLLEGGKLSLQERSLLHFTLGGWLAKTGCHDEAFEHYREANAAHGDLLVQRGEQFDRGLHARLVDSLIATFDRAFFTKVRAYGSDSAVPVFVVGMPRSGTTLVEQILSSHPLVFGAGELPDIEQMVRALPGSLQSGEEYPACIARLDRNAIQALGQQYLARLAKASAGAARVVDKDPYNFMHLGFIRALFPRAHMIRCRREPLDTCVACYFQRFEARKNFTSAFSSLEDLGFFYREYVRVMAHWSEGLLVPIHEVRYEDLVLDQRKVSKELISFCGLDWDERCMQFYKNPRPVQTASAVQVRRPIYRDSIGRWKHYRAHLGPLIAALGDD